MSVIVCSYNSRSTIDAALRSLRDQEGTDEFEVLVVESGSDGCTEHLRVAYPEVKLVRSERRLWPGQARNRGLRAASGRFISFLPADGTASSSFVRARLDAHRQGFPLVGGSVISGMPGWVSSAAHYLEYSAVLPSTRILSRQVVPHCLSYSRKVFETVGEYPEDTRTGEDTVFNERCIAAGLRCRFEPGAQLIHRSPQSLRAFLGHEFTHGRGLAQCVYRHDHESPIGSRQRLGVANALIRYPIASWWRAVIALRGEGLHLLRYLALSHLVIAGLLATGMGAWSEFQRLGYVAGTAS